MIRLVSEEEPDVVALQEVPLWGLSRLAAWSGMRAFAAPTKRALLGPLAARLQRLDATHVRSHLTGQANALLVGPRLGASEAGIVQISRRGERRVCQLLRLAAGERLLLVANLHASAGDAVAARGELERTAALVAGAEACAVLGDTNSPGAGLPDFSAPLSGIDQILVRGLDLVEGPALWPDVRRAVGGRHLSDHAPVEAVVSWT